MQAAEGNQIATVRFIGLAEFDEGTWVGVEYALPVGKNDGEVKVCAARAPRPPMSAGQALLQVRAELRRLCAPGQGVLARQERAGHPRRLPDVAGTFRTSQQIEAILAPTCAAARPPLRRALSASNSDADAVGSS